MVVEMSLKKQKETESKDIYVKNVENGFLRKEEVRDW